MAAATMTTTAPARMTMVATVTMTTTATVTPTPPLYCLVTTAWTSAGGGHGEVSRRPPAVLAAVAVDGTILNFFFIPKIVFTGGAFYFAAIFTSSCLSITACENALFSLALGTGGTSGRQQKHVFATSKKPFLVVSTPNLDFSP